MQLSEMHVALMVKLTIVVFYMEGFVIFNPFLDNVLILFSLKITKPIQWEDCQKCVKAVLTGFLLIMDNSNPFLSL